MNRERTLSIPISSRTLLTIAVFHMALACNQPEMPDTGSIDQRVTDDIAGQDAATLIDMLRRGELNRLFSNNGRTAGGLSVEDMVSLLSQGYKPNDVLLADSLGAHHGVSIRELLERGASGEPWDRIIFSLSAGQPGPLPQPAPERELIPLVARNANLSESDVTRLIAEGHNINDIAYAGRYAIDNGTSIQRALRANVMNDWDVAGRQLAMTSRFELTPELVMRTGLDQTALEGLLAQGHELTDIMQAGAISQASKHAVSDILRLKNGRDWAVVIGELLPGADLPEAPQGLGAPPPSVPGAPLPGLGDLATPPPSVPGAPLPGLGGQGGDCNSEAANTLGCLPHVHYEYIWHEGRWVWYQYWWPHYHPGYYYYYYYYDWWCRCWRLGWYYVPGYIHWHLDWAYYYIPGYWEIYTWVHCHPIDTTPPVSSLSMSPSFPNGANGWYVGPINITLSATDTSLVAGGANLGDTATLGVSKIEYNLNNGPWQTYVNTFTIGTDGNWILRYRATDSSGNVESTRTAPTIKLDRVPPSISSTRTPANNYGWNNEDVTVGFSCTDVTSGIDHCSGAITLSSEAAAQSVVGSARDKAGHNASQTVSNINIDKTDPDVSIAGGGEYTVDQTVRITCTATDGLSGLTHDPCASPLVDARAYTYDPGVYSISVDAVDKADNIASAHASYTIKVTANSLGNLAEEFLTAPGNSGNTHGLVNSMRSKLEAIEASSASGNDQARAGQVRAFTNQVQAQVGKTLTVEQAQILIRLVNFL